MSRKLTLATAISALALAAVVPIIARAGENGSSAKSPDILNPSDDPNAKNEGDEKKKDKVERRDRNRDDGDVKEPRQNPDVTDREPGRKDKERDLRAKESKEPAPTKVDKTPETLEPPKQQPVKAPKLEPAKPPPSIEATPKPPVQPSIAVPKPDPLPETTKKAAETERSRERLDRDRRDDDDPREKFESKPAAPQQVEKKSPKDLYQDRIERMRAIQDQRREALRRALGGGGSRPTATLEDIKSKRKERREDGGKRIVIEEPDNRTIVQQNNRISIDRDERDRVRRFAPNARIERGPGKNSITVVERGNARIYTETDERGRLVRRYRRDPSGRDVIIIDNRRRKNRFGRDVAIGAGVAAGAVLLDSLVRVAPPRVLIPREKYIVRGSRASEDDYYEALSAPPVDRYDDRYTLDEIRATARLRERMRRVDLDDINFAFGAWDIDPSQYRKLDRLARAIKRVLRRDPDEVFMIEGHTDAVGSRVDNLTLSDRRAETVAYILTQEFGVPFESLVTQGYGEEYLKIPTDAPERLNRRVAAIRITPLLDRDFRGASAEGPPRYDRDGDRGGYADRRDDSRGDDGDYRDDSGGGGDRDYDGRDDDRYDEPPGPPRY